MIRGLFLFILLLVHSCKQSDNPNGNLKEKGETKISNQLYTLAGKPLDSGYFKNKVVFVNYWATWCKPCIYEMPGIDSLKSSLNNESIVFMMVSDEPINKIKAFKTKHNFDLEFIKLKGDYRNDGVQSLPTTHIYDKYGKKVFDQVGIKDWSSEASVNMVFNLLEK